MASSPIDRTLPVFLSTQAPDQPESSSRAATSRPQPSHYGVAPELAGLVRPFSPDSARVRDELRRDGYSDRSVLRMVNHLRTPEGQQEVVAQGVSSWVRTQLPRGTDAAPYMDLGHGARDGTSTVNQPAWNLSRSELLGLLIAEHNPQDNAPPLPSGQSISSQASFPSLASSHIAPVRTPRSTGSRGNPYPPPLSGSSGSPLVTDAAGSPMLNKRGGVLTVKAQRKREQDRQPVTDAAGNPMFNTRGGVLTVGALRQRQPVTDEAGNVLPNSTGGVLTADAQRRRERDRQPVTDEQGNPMPNKRGGVLTANALRMQERNRQPVRDEAGNALANSWGGVLTANALRMRQPVTDEQGNPMLNTRGGVLTVAAQRMREAKQRKAETEQDN